MSHALVVTDLTVGYHRPVPAIEAVSLELRPSAIVAVIGPNGAGKTTLLHTICGVLRAWSGNVSIDGVGVVGRSPHEIVRMGVAQVPEGRRILPGLTVGENLRMGAYSIRKGSAVRLLLDEVFELFPLLKLRYRQQGGTLSGGEQQMLAIGRALMSRPTYLLLDEPSMGLAPVIVDRIFDLVVALKNRGLGILVVEQNANVALGIADQGIVLEEGRMALSGSAASIREDPRVKWTYLAVR